MQAYDVLGLGVSTLDVLTLVEHFPQGDEVQRADEITIQGGGPVATALATLSRLGARTAMLDRLGDDWRGERIRAEFIQQGVSVEHILIQPGCTSSLASVWVQQGSGARSIAYAPGSAAELDATDVPEALLRSAKFLHVNGRHWRACLHAARLAKSAGVQVSFDGGAHRYRAEMRSLLPLCDVCILSQHFAQAYTQRAEIPGAAHALLQEGMRVLVITDGLRGSWVFDNQGSAFHQPAFLLPAVADTTGCGDAYHGAFLFGLLRAYSLAQTAALASAVAALNSRRLGGRAALPSLDEAQAFLSAHDCRNCFSSP